VTLLFWILRLLVLLLIVRFVVTMIRQAALYSKGGPKPAAGRSKRQPERIGGTLVQDPQCGTYLPKERAIAVTSGGSTQYFCSDKCRHAWTSNAAGQ
jgi:YHS domain-containing protein